MSFRVEQIGIATVFVDDFSAVRPFYVALFGEENSQAMNDHSCYFSINDDQGIYVAGGFTPVTRTDKQCGTTFALQVSDINACHMRLKELGTQMVHDVPIAMNDVTSWFQCYDPAGNIIEFIGPHAPHS